MQLTSHTDYALRLLIYLAVHRGETPATVQDAATRYGISANHLAKVAQRLVQLGYVNSHRGRGGGLELACDTNAIGLGKLVRQTENLVLVECFGNDSECPIEPACGLKHVLDKAQQAFLGVLDDYTLADLIGQRSQLVQLLGEKA